MDLHFDTVEYRGYSIEIHDDMNPINPWEFGDVEPPILVYMSDVGRGHVTEYEFDDQFPELDEATVRKHWPYMLSVMGWSVRPHTPANWRDLRQFAEDNLVSPGEVLDFVQEQYGDYVAEMPVRDRFEAIAEAYGWLGVATYMRQIHGFCQRDFGYVLAVATPEWAERVGAPAETHSDQLKNAVELFENFAFGSVYGFIVKDPDSHEIDDGSCWGFFGMDHEKSGLLEEARMSVDADIPEREKRLRFEARARDYVRDEIAYHRFWPSEIQVSDRALVDPTEGGAWVTARVFVPVLPE